MNEFIYNTSEVVSQNASVPEQKFLGYELCGQKDPILTTKLQDFDFTDSTLNPSEIASRLIETCKQYKIYGIAANQCGLNHRVMVAGAEDNYVAFFNPIIIEASGEELQQEADISNLGLSLPVKRLKSIIVEYLDYEGEEKTVRLDDLTARVVQQGIDRLNGIDFKTRVSKLVLDRANASLNKKIKRFVKSQMRLK